MPELTISDYSRFINVESYFFISLYTTFIMTFIATIFINTKRRKLFTMTFIDIKFNSWVFGLISSIFILISWIDYYGTNSFYPLTLRYMVIDFGVSMEIIFCILILNISIRIIYRVKSYSMKRINLLTIIYIILYIMLTNIISGLSSLPQYRYFRYVIQGSFILHVVIAIIVYTLSYIFVRKNISKINSEMRKALIKWRINIISTIIVISVSIIGILFSGTISKTLKLNKILTKLILDLAFSFTYTITICLYLFIIYV